MSLRALVVTATALAAAAACGDGGSSTDAGPIDARVDAGACAVEYGAATLSDLGATSELDFMDQVGELVGSGALNADPDVLRVELYNNFGIFRGGRIGTSPEDDPFELRGDELQYATCGVCVRLLPDVDAMGEPAGNSYLATGGSVDLSSVSGNLTFTLTDVRFTEVEIDAATFESTPVGGCAASIDSVTFDAPIEPL